MKNRLDVDALAARSSNSAHHHSFPERSLVSFPPSRGACAQPQSRIQTFTFSVDSMLVKRNTQFSSSDHPIGQETEVPQMRFDILVIDKAVTFRLAGLNACLRLCQDVLLPITP